MRVLANLGLIVAMSTAECAFGADIEKDCTDLRGAVVSECVQHYTEAAGHTDAFMRNRALGLGAAALEKRNAPYAIEDAELKQAAADAAARKRATKQQAEAKAARAKLAESCAIRGMLLGSPKIGMLAAANRECGWGEPNSISRTTTAAGRREQWVYSPRRFLYFNNGVLEAIQD